MTNVSFKELTDSIVGYEPHRWFIDRLNLFLEDLSNMQEAKETIYSNFSTLTLDDLRDIAGRLNAKTRLSRFDFNNSSNDAIDSVANAYNSLVHPPTPQQELERAADPKPNEFYKGNQVMGLMGLFGPFDASHAYQSTYIRKYSTLGPNDFYLPYFKRASHTFVSNGSGSIGRNGSVQRSAMSFLINTYAPNMYRVFDDICHKGLTDLDSDYVTPSDWVGSTSGNATMIQYNSTMEGTVGHMTFDQMAAVFDLTKVGQGSGRISHGTNSYISGYNMSLARMFGAQDYSGLHAAGWSMAFEYQGSVELSEDYGYDGGSFYDYNTPQYFSVKSVIKLYLNQFNFSALIRQIQDALSVVSLHHDIISTLISAKDLSSEQRRIAFIKAARSLLLNVPSDVKTYLILHALGMYDDDGVLGLINYGHDDNNDKDLTN